MVPRPPYLAHEVDRAGAVGIDALRKLPDLAGGDDPWLIPLLCALIPEDSEIRPGNDGHHDLGVFRLELRNLRRVIAGGKIEAARIYNSKAGFGDRLRQDLGEDATVVVVGPAHPELTIGLDAAPCR